VNNVKIQMKWLQGQIVNNKGEKMNEYEIEEHELKTIINECIENSNNQDLRTILDCLAEIGHDVTRPTEPTRR